MTNLDIFFKSYIECMLWSSTDENGNYLNENYDIDDIDKISLEKLKSLCERFLKRSNGLIVDFEQAGHDFWLTQHGHGTGFWDRGLGETGEILTNISHSFSKVQFFIINDVIFLEV